MGFLRNTGVFIIGAVLFVATILLSSIFLVGITWLATVLYPFILFIRHLTLESCFLILLPLSFFKTTRTFSATGFAVSAMIMAITVWLFSVLTVYQLWGFGGLIAGIILGIVGIVPLALIAAGLHHMWAADGRIALDIALYFGLYVFGIYLRSTVKTPLWTSTAPPPEP
jgi:hypothetical protein